MIPSCREISEKPLPFITTMRITSIK
jgi:hypothetical protein